MIGSQVSPVPGTFQGASDQFADSVQNVRDTFTLGLSSAPTFIINEKYSIVGGQPTKLFLKALKEIALASTLPDNE